MSEETFLKPREYRRDANGMFERPGATLKNTQKDKLKNNQDLVTPKHGHGGLRAGAGRPKGVPNKVTTKLKEAILQAAENAGGEGGIVSYLERLAVENSSAFSSLLGKVLPSTLAAEAEGELVTQVTFKRVIVYPKEMPKVIEHQRTENGFIADERKAEDQDKLVVYQGIDDDGDTQQDRGSARQGDF